MAESKSSTKISEEPTKGEVAEGVKNLTSALRGDLTKLAGTKADKAISYWQTTLEGIGGAGLKSIATELGKLKPLVTDDEPDGKKIARQLSTLADKCPRLPKNKAALLAPR